MLSKLFRVAILLPAFFWLYTIFFGSLGADPAKQLNHAAGETALYYLLLNLAVGVAIGLSFRFPSWLRFLLLNRRYLGVVTFVYLVFHVFLYLVMEGFAGQAFTQLYQKTYLAVGSLAWLILLVLAVTSNDVSVRRLGGRRWKTIHRTVYLAAGLVTVHVLLIEKADLQKYGTIFAGLWLLMAVRWGRRWWQVARPPAQP